MTLFYVLSKMVWRQARATIRTAICPVLICLGFSANLAFADVLVQYDPAAEDQVGGFILQTPLPPDVVKTSSLAASLLFQSETGGAVNVPVWPVEAIDAFSEADFVSFTIDPHPSVVVTFDNLTWSGASYLNSAVSLTVRVNLDGFTLDVGTFESVGPGSRVWEADIDLSILPPVIGTPVEFRIYPGNTGPDADWVDLVGNLAGGTGLVLNGTATEPGNATTHIAPAGAATANDNGPADGVFDEIIPGSFITWNGFVDSRLATEFDLAAAPDGVVAAELKLRNIGFTDGPRFLQLHGFTGDGGITLPDFEQNNLLGDAALSPAGNDLVFDVTPFVLDLLRRGEGWAGINIREEPVCAPQLDCVTIGLDDISLEIIFVDVIFQDSYEFIDRPVSRPAITGPGNQVTDEDTATGDLPFTIGDDKLISLLQVAATSSDQGIVPDGNISLGGSGANRTVNIMPAENANGGPVTITLTVTDSQNLSTNHAFDLTVTPVNDPPMVTNPGTFSSIGNVGIQVTDGPGDLLAAVTDPDGDTPVVSAAILSSANSGFVQTFADGTFTYLPPAGFEGSDSFNFTVDDQSGEANSTVGGQVSITVSDVIWFLDASVGASGDGTLASPFKNVTAFVTAPDEAGDNIFFSQGSYSAGLELLDNQVVIADGIPGTVGTTLGIVVPPFSIPLPVPSGNRPFISGPGDGFVLGLNNTVRGMLFEATTGHALKGSNVGTLIISDTTINTTGGGLDIGSGVLNVQLSELSATATGLEAIKLDGVSGFVGISSGNIAISNEAAIKITGVGGGVELDVVLRTVGSSTSPGHGITLTNTTGSFTISGDGGSSRNGSGGTIVGSASHGIQLDSTTNISLNQVNVRGSLGDGISGQHVTNFALRYSEITDNGNGPGEHGIQFNPNLLGTATFLGSVIAGSYNHNLRILNDTGVLQPLEITNSVIGPNHATFGEDGLSIKVEGSASVTGSVSDTTFNSNRVRGIDVDTESSALADLFVGGSVISGGETGIRLRSSQSANVLFDVNGGNQIENQSSFTGKAIDLVVVADSTFNNGLTGRINNNVISNTTQGLGVDIRGQGKLLMDFSGNTVTTGIAFEPLLGRLGGVSDAVTVNFTATNNTFGASQDLFTDTFELDYWSTSSVCLNIRDNTVNRADFANAFDIRKSDALPGQPNIESFGFECVGPCPDAETLLENANTVLPSVGSSVDPMTFVGPGTCLVP